MAEPCQRLSNGNDLKRGRGCFPPPFCFFGGVGVFRLHLVFGFADDQFPLNMTECSRICILLISLGYLTSRTGGEGPSGWTESFSAPLTRWMSYE